VEVRYLSEQEILAKLRNIEARLERIEKKVDKIYNELP
jgi:tetrahydromethanopterin S-methyltransferase subunit G